MENNGFKVSRAKTEHLQTRGDTDVVRMKRYMETETVNLPTVQSFKYLGSFLVLNYVYSKQPIFGLTQEWLREVWSPRQAISLLLPLA